MQVMHFTVSDIDECTDATTNNYCDSNAMCTNTPGSFHCTCNQGYTGNGTICLSKQDSYYSIVGALYMYVHTEQIRGMYTNDCDSVCICMGVNFDEYPLLVPPSSPAMLSTTSQSTSINLIWSQSPGDVVDSYQISYSFAIRGCGTPVNRVASAPGSSREYTLTGLEENSYFTISITAMNGAGSSPPATTTASTAIAGRIHPS